MLRETGKQMAACGFLVVTVFATAPLPLRASELVGVTQASEPQTGTWGDQGDGTYHNPILNADYPDVDVEQFGDTYYMISSKQHMSPGMVILESKDMVNWRTIGHVWPRLSWDPKYNWDRMDGYKFGVWAGDLAYHDGRWYCYQIDTTNGLYMSSAADVRGPWTEPHLMLRKTGWTDPAVYWDDEGKQAYLVCNFGRLEAQKPGNHLRLSKMSWDGRELLDEGRVIHLGTGAEAAKIYRVEGRWYIFFAQWFRPDPHRPDDPDADSGDRKQMVLRSKTDSIYGPYDVKVVSGASATRSANGSWAPARARRRRSSISPACVPASEPGSRVLVESITCSASTSSETAYGGCSSTPTAGSPAVQWLTPPNCTFAPPMTATRLASPGAPMAGHFMISAPPSRSSLASGRATGSASSAGTTASHKVTSTSTGSGTATTAQSPTRNAPALDDDGHDPYRQPDTWRRPCPMWRAAPEYPVMSFDVGRFAKPSRTE